HCYGQVTCAAVSSDVCQGLADDATKVGDGRRLELGRPSFGDRQSGLDAGLILEVIELDGGHLRESARWRGSLGTKVVDEFAKVRNDLAQRRFNRVELSE